MKLTLKQPHLSLVSLSTSELPAFTVITGKNGAGKTHLLQAMANGHVHIDIAPQHQNEIRYYDWNNLVPNKAQAFESRTLIKERSDLFNTFDSQRKRYTNLITDAARNASFPHELLLDVATLSALTETECMEIFADEDSGRQGYQKLQAAVMKATNNVYNRLKPSTANGRAVQAVQEWSGKSIFTITRDEFIDNVPAGWGQANLFQQTFARLFVTYRDLELENQLRRLAYEDGEADAPPLSKEEFVQRHNVAPWDFVNQVLRDAHLDFEVDAPARSRKEPYSPKLTKVSNGIAVDFLALSSGEKILMSFALCVYYARDRRQITVFPKVLLLDEVDAPLHPSMCQSLVNTITKTLVGEYGINVVLATHSASTVAVAPPPAIHVMQYGKPGIHKVSKGHALNLLTAGVPTLAIGFDGRRQVFVESKTDSSVYESIYQILKPDLSSDRSITFIAVGNSKSGDGAGCDKVRQIVHDLSTAGNLSVLGLVDWDTKNTSSDRLLVLAEQHRYSIENCIYDPVLIAATIARDAGKRTPEIGLDTEETYLSFQHFHPGRLQQIVDAVEQAILGQGNRDRVDVHYYGGFSIRVSIDYLRMRGHLLEESLLLTFPELNMFNCHTGDLLRHIVTTVIKENKQLTPQHLVDALNHLLSVDIIATDAGATEQTDELDAE